MKLTDEICKSENWGIKNYRGPTINLVEYDFTFALNNGKKVL